MHYDLVIFDMDGTLINSEHMSEKALSEATVHLRRPMTVEEVSDAFRGRAFQYTLDTLTEMQGGPLPEVFGTSLNAAYIKAVQTELEPSEGAREAIEILSTRAQVCVASNSEPDGVRFCLESVGFLDFFDGHVYSAAEVDHPKPAPDLFLHAASQFDIAPERCLVIEDSALGLSAAKAAGMGAVGYCGNDPDSRAALETVGYPVFDSFKDIIVYLEEDEVGH